MQIFDLKKHHGTMRQKTLDEIQATLSRLDHLPMETKIECLNEIRLLISEHSPFKAEPIDRIQWISADDVIANDYNPNSVAPPEMELLRHSILMDGYTQPIVAYLDNGKFTVVDGFHRSRVGKECEDVSERVRGYLPITSINTEREGVSDRMAATIRHNRARGKHQVDSMSEIVVDLRKRNWSAKKIGKELGMDEDEVLRLTQISGLTEMFSDKEFSEAWEAQIYDEPEEIE